MQNSSNTPDVKDPITGEAMVLETRYAADALTAGLAEDTSRQAGSAERVSRAIQEKEKQFGRVFVNPRTGYRMRVKDDAARGAERDESAQGGGGGRTDGTHAGGDHGPSELERANARIRELEGQIAGR